MMQPQESLNQDKLVHQSMDSQLMDARNLNPPLQGKRCFEIQGTLVTVDQRYDVQNMIGCGAYGIVYSAFDS